MENKCLNPASLVPLGAPVEARSRFKFALDEMITVREAARLRHVTRGAIWNLIRRERLRMEMVYGRAFVYRAEVESFTPLSVRPVRSQGTKRS